MIETGKEYKLKASRRTIYIVSMSKSGRHATIRFLDDRLAGEYPYSTSDIEAALHQEGKTG